MTTSTSGEPVPQDVVVGEEAGSKLAKAKKLGIATLDEDAFRTLVRA